ncbi:alpha/beta hydrolase [Caulobacter segnis]|uniref:alpha/beta fold hydrolase n=1 Tax=Caulobacter segnis TaxID=88688 RepID=UPI00240EC60E|nr:alpha/beta hydrolase [Caulobacter segnis]MDG2521338.1 alpha/beta hydrolase [Caulobacter segnis]
MPPFNLLRFLAGLISLGLLAASIYLLWTFARGEELLDPDGVPRRVREDWRLWTGAALLAWSLLGRFPMLFVLARKDDGGPDAHHHGRGVMLQTPRGSDLHVETYGPAGAPVIVLTHGWGMDSTFWRAAKAQLGDRFRLVAWDLPGLGRSKPGRGGITLEGFAEDLKAVVDHAGGRPVLVGHSIGGMTIQTLLRDDLHFQGRLAGLVLLNTTFTNPLRTMVFSKLLLGLQGVLEQAMKLTVILKPVAWLANWQGYLSGSAHLAHRLGFGRSVTRSQLEHVTLLAVRNSPAAEAKGNLAMFHWHADGALERVHAPTLVVGGDMDIVTKLEASERIASVNPKAEFRVVRGSNHLGPLEQAAEYNDIIADFTLRVQRALPADAPISTAVERTRENRLFPDQPSPET